MVTTISEYGGLLAAESGAEVFVKPLSAEDLAALIRTKAADAIIDCTHPYACEVTAMAQAVAKDLGIHYIRYERPYTPQMENTDVYCVSSWQEAAEQAADLAEVIFLTTGSRNLADFLRQAAIRGKRVIARVLPDPEVILKCQSLGLLPRDMIAMQGPFSYEMNKVMFADYGAQVVITKDAGVIGGTDTKMAAAQDLGIPVVVIRRPEVEYTCIATTFAEVKQRLSERLV
jgi:precorrin-6A/cobalt-precorrin-6A reductase